MSAAAETGVTKKQTTVDAVVHAIEKALAKGDKVSLGNLITIGISPMVAPIALQI